MCSCRIIYYILHGSDKNTLLRLGRVTPSALTFTVFSVEVRIELWVVVDVRGSATSVATALLKVFLVENASDV